MLCLDQVFVTPCLDQVFVTLCLDQVFVALSFDQVFGVLSLDQVFGALCLDQVFVALRSVCCTGLQARQRQCRGCSIAEALHTLVQMFKYLAMLLQSS